MTHAAFNAQSLARTGAAGHAAAGLGMVAGATYAALATGCGYPDVVSQPIGVFLAGAAPGVLATLVVWFVRLARFGRAVRGQMAAVSLLAPAVVACLPTIIAGH